MNKKLFLLILGMALSLFVSCTIDYDKGTHWTTGKGWRISDSLF